MADLEISKSVLREYGKVANFLRLNEFISERDKLTQILFDINKHDTKIENPSSTIKFSRKYTFLLILELYNLFTTMDLNFTDDDFRNILYYNMTKKHNNIVTYKTNIEDIKRLIIQWKYFQLQNYLTFGLENILIAFTEVLKIQGEKGMSFEVFFDTYKDFYIYLKEYLKIDFLNKNLHEVIQELFYINGIDKTFDDNSLKEFNKKITIESKLSEFNIQNRFREILKPEDIKLNIAHSVLLLIITYLRYKYFQNTNYQETMWVFKNNYNDRLSFLTLERAIESDLYSKSILEFFRYLLERVIEQHNHIANLKLRSRNNTFRFQYRDDSKKYFYRRGYKSEKTSDKFDTVREIFDDLGIIEKKNNKFEITEYGIKLLRNYSYG